MTKQVYVTKNVSKIPQVNKCKINKNVKSARLKKSKNNGFKTKNL